ncbi:P-loop containing nucleoside triphosphate hydrolase protein [Suillus placidus]|uniref:P-loop containing nucleoside triphosphate hydrolase protein n=1 Tax=Suillus placidus TaxID=48579 RepID=A0A9P6ZXG4_9AGAM|nr:P-loop containing nucleoside triphosphate hydrolase protein [Suillus placidus]
MQTAPSSRSAMPPPPGRALSTVCGVWRFLTMMLTRSQSNISDQSVACPSYHRVEEALGRTDASKAVRPAIVGATGAGKNYWLNWLIKKQMALSSLDATSSSGRTSSTVHTTGQGAAYPNYHRIEEASCRTDTCNVVIFGETGSGKSSLVNLITGKEKAPTSPDATGCTTEPTVYEHDVTTQNKTVKVQLFDTAGLDEGSEGTIPTMQGQRALKTLLRTLKKNRGIHLLIYCVQGTKDAWALQRNYKSLHSKVKGRVPIVLVVTALEDREPEMEDWWRNNETSISELGMNFAGHACITAVTIDQDDTDKLRQRREQSYDAVCSLFEHCRLQNRSAAHRVIPIPSARKTKNIVLFGEAGAGKSSVVNLMAGRDVAYTSPGMRRCTLQWQDYTINFDGESYKVFDTIGIEESGLEMEEYLVAVANAYRFIKTLDAEGGVDLLLFCIRAGRFTAALQSNYRFFHEFLCEKKVPIVLAITNLEREQRMEDWWDREHSIFPRHEIHVAGHACITAANGLDGRHQQLYEESRIAIRTLVKENITGGPNEVWTGGNNVFVSLVRALKKLLVKNTHIRKMNLTGQLTKRCGMPRETAGQLVDMIEQGEVKVDSDTA